MLPFYCTPGLAWCFPGSCVEAALAAADSQLLTASNAQPHVSCTGHAGRLTCCCLAEEEVMEKMFLDTVSSTCIKRCRKQRDGHPNPKGKGSPFVHVHFYMLCGVRSGVTQLKTFLCPFTSTLPFLKTWMLSGLPHGEKAWMLLLPGSFLCWC